MATMTPATTVPPTTLHESTLRALTKLTGESRFDIAVRVTLKDSVAYRLEKIDKEIKLFEQKYGMPFDQFSAQGEDGLIPNQFSYEVESDYLEWDGLVSRKQTVEKIKKWLN